MASTTGQFKAQDQAFGDLLDAGGPALGESKALLDRVAPALPVLLANMVSLGDIAVTYRADLEQLLVLYPQGTAVMSAIALPDSGVTGFLPVQQQRVPSAQDYPDRPSGELYCRVPQDSTLNVRGVRNIPCENDPAKRAPTVELCESDEQYVPLNDGFNWKGDPNATLSGQSVPQYPPGSARSSDAAPPQAVPPVAAVPYDPATGDYIGPDGRRYTQGDLRNPGNKTWQSMLAPPTP
jgi:phospholipid/cholesterol/gamma-HCH transport system substrate-binding protein